MKGKRNIFLIGPMGAGKTTIGKQLAQNLHLEFVDSDQEIEARTGAPIDWIFDIEGEDGFRKREKSIISELTQRQGIVLATGGGAVIESENRTFLAGRGIVVYLETSIEQQVERTRRDKRRPLLQSSEDPEATLVQLHTERDKLYREIADIVVATNENSIKSVANKIVSQIGEG
ncbi:shikimate kinase AroK [Aliikangiella coralliicola]|uniref:Shikimate kinase n=2 Tax=Aliikangiella coralliicola TaxID=2592383 RepID=A0A545UI01_9GAMM|nr:shikimate kinase AroK [Aliikangiella coralliicola]TQV89095.1 shikimate kinase AroK [Aliikangiella coralliicola]